MTKFLCTHDWKFFSSPPSAAYMLQWTGSTLVQVMACRLFQCWLIVKWTPRNKLHWNLNRILPYSFQKCTWNCHLPKWRPFCPGRDELFMSLFIFFQYYKLGVVDWQSGWFEDLAPMLSIYDSTNMSRALYLHRTTQKPRLPVIQADSFVIKFLTEEWSVYLFVISYLALTGYPKDFPIYPKKVSVSGRNGEYSRDPFYWHRWTNIRTRRGNNIFSFIWNVIARSCPSFSGGFLS